MWNFTFSILSDEKISKKFSEVAAALAKEIPVQGAWRAKCFFAKLQISARFLGLG